MAHQPHDFGDALQIGTQYFHFAHSQGRLPQPLANRFYLRDIYNEQFRYNYDSPLPNFSVVLFALRNAHMIQVHPSGDVKIMHRMGIHFDTSADGPSEGPSTRPEPTDVKFRTGMNFAERWKEIYRLLRDHREWLVDNKLDVTVISTPEEKNGRIQMAVSLGQEYTANLSVRNQGLSPVQLRRVEAGNLLHVFKIKSDASPETPFDIQPGATYLIKVCCLTHYSGYFPLTLALELIGVDSETPFYILRFLSAFTQSELSKFLAPTTPYHPRVRQVVQPHVQEELLFGQRLCPGESQLERSIPLGNYFCPPHVIEFAEMSRTRYQFMTRASSEIRGELAAPLTFRNYWSKFELLLHLEEAQMKEDILQYSREDVSMTKAERGLLKMEVPDVSERRPSVLRGDYVDVIQSDTRNRFSRNRFRGYVHHVELDVLKINFHQRLLNEFIDNMTFDVTFTFNRLPLMVEHRSVELLKRDGLVDFVFPKESHGSSYMDSSSRLLYYDRKLEGNPEQCSAIQHIVSGISRPAPYLLFGPPGTGKTTTMVEAIKQVLKYQPTTHVLACATSNSAADLLCQNLVPHIDRRNLYRIIARSRSWEDVPQDIKQCCNWDPDIGEYIYPSKNDLMQYNLLVVTLVTAGRLVSAGFPPGHFSHVFVDEAAHAIEPECLIPVAGLLKPMSEDNLTGGQLVLAGDPKQLGPILRSSLAKKNGLEMSLLERLMTSNPLYQRREEESAYDIKFVTKLLNNYRSHPDILKVPNMMFYDDELKACADEILRNSFCNWERLPKAALKKAFPIIFHGILGKDEREESNPSFFNIREIEQVLYYLKELLCQKAKKGGGAKLSPKEVGIITPYRKQVMKIRQALKRNKEFSSLNNITELKVGCVEEFQGQERRVIIISTVRSATEYLDFDKRFCLGFIQNPKRFNVALTRAKALLIVIGNPITLGKDENWRTFIEYCVSNGGATGDMEGFQGSDGGAADLSQITHRMDRIKLEGNFFDPNKRKNQKTMLASRKKVTLTRSQGTVIQYRGQSNLPILLLVKSQNQDEPLDMEELMKYCLMPVPPSLGTPDGFFRKTKKAAMMNYLLKNTTRSLPYPEDALFIQDGMALLHVLRNLPPTLGEICLQVLDQMVAKKHFLFSTDSYHPESIKAKERLRRQLEKKDSSEMIIIAGPATRRPDDFKGFLANDDNKKQLCQLLLQVWSSQQAVSTLERTDMAVLIVEGEAHQLISSNGKVEVRELTTICSDQEETDTRVVLYLHHAAALGYKNAVVKTTDTDIFMILLYHAHTIKLTIYLDMGSGKHRQLLNLSEFAESLRRQKGEDYCATLLGFYVFTGEDCTSSFKGMGKVRPLKKLEKNPVFQEAFSQLGDDWNIKPQVLRQLEQFTCLMYEQSSKSSVDVIRTKLLWEMVGEDNKLTSKSKVELAHLPPCHSALKPHVQRVNHRVALFKRAHKPRIEKPKPDSEGQGWTLIDGLLEPVWSCGPVLPASLVDLLYCIDPEEVDSKDEDSKDEEEEEDEFDTDFIETRSSEEFQTNTDLEWRADR
uniref:putative helicase MOV-10 n=1 Tax=Myxine glutinosa TaxID=7769 RepID=UPI00358F4B42